MKIKHLIPIACMALGLTLSMPGATMQTNASATELQQPDGWSEDKQSYYQDGKKLTGICQIEGKYYYFSNNGTLVTSKNGKIKINGSYYFISSEGTLARNAWVASASAKYYAGDNAKLYTDKAARIGNYVYCFSPKATMMKNGLKTVNGKTYLLKANGRASVGKKKFKGSRYIFDINGVMQTGLIRHTNGKLYYADKDTGKLKTGFFTVGSSSYYAKSTGALRTGWAKYNGTRYYFNEKNGSMKVGWVKYNGKYYYYNKNGTIKTGWIKTKGKKFYSAKTGSSKGARIIGIQWLSGKRYYFSQKGVLKTGWVKRSGNKYYMNSKGIVSTGWQKIKGSWYYFEHSGAMRTGWVVHNQKFYYLNPNTGAMVTGTRVIDGRSYTFNRNGTYSGGQLPGEWSIRVNRQANVVTVFKGSIPVKAFLCSTGVNNATPAGSFRTMDKLYTHELNGPTFGYYCSHITSDILFHSIPAPTTSRSGVPSYKFNLLGQQASAGCIRLAMGDAYWLYTTCPIGTSVLVYDDARYPGALGKPPATTMPTSPTYGFDPTDPNIMTSKTPS